MIESDEMDNVKWLEMDNVKWLREAPQHEWNGSALNKCANEIERLREKVSMMRVGYEELDEITNSNDVMLMKRKVLRRHLRDILQKAGIREGGNNA